MRGVLVVWLVGCGGSSTARDFPRACDESFEGDCVLFSGPDWLPTEVSEGCAGDVVDECPDGAIGRCVIDGGTRFETQSYFYPGFWTAQSASEACRTRFSNSSWLPQ